MLIYDYDNENLVLLHVFGITTFLTFSHCSLRFISFRSHLIIVNVVVWVMFVYALFFFVMFLGWDVITLSPHPLKFTPHETYSFFINPSHKTPPPSSPDPDATWWSHETYETCGLVRWERTWIEKRLEDIMLPVLLFIMVIPTFSKYIPFRRIIFQNIILFLALIFYFAKFQKWRTGFFLSLLDCLC